MNIKYFMKKALEQANKALLADEIPIGAVLVDNNNNKIKIKFCLIYYCNHKAFPNQINNNNNKIALLD